MPRRPDNHRREPRRQPSRPRDASGNLVRIYGFHSVRAALSSPRRQGVHLFATEAAAARLEAETKQRGAPVTIVSADEITTRLGAAAVHQGVLLEAKPLEEVDVSEIPDDGFILVLDQITDPHNFGAILRTAAAFGLDAVVTTERHSPTLSGALAKSASGALEHVSIVSVVNLARALKELGERGFLRIGLDSEGSESLSALKLSRPLAFVLGAEGKGLRRLTRDNCDAIARLDLPGPLKSLNVSNACASALTLATLRVSARAG